MHHPPAAMLLLLVALASGCQPSSSLAETRSPGPDPSQRSCPASTSAIELGGVPGCVEEVAFPSGDLALAGQWFTPRTEGPHPAVVVVRGSGESTRGNLWTETLAGVFLAEGAGVLIPDKRGSGMSQGDWRTADFGELASDALSGVRYLAGRPEVDARSIGLMGLSQGGEVVAIAGARSDSVSFLVNVVGSAVPFIENVRFEMRHTFREEGLSGDRLNAAMSMIDSAIAYVRGTVTWDSYEAALLRTADVLGDEFTGTFFLHDPDHWRWDFFRRMADFDPVDWWRQVDQPTLVLLGGDDPNTDTPKTARRLRNAFEQIGHPTATVCVFEGLGHALWNMTGPVEEHGLHADVRRTMTEWFRSVQSHRP